MPRTFMKPTLHNGRPSHLSFYETQPIETQPLRLSLVISKANDRPSQFCSILGRDNDAAIVLFD